MNEDLEDKRESAAQAVNVEDFSAAVSVSVGHQSIVQPFPYKFCLEDGYDDSIKMTSSSQKSFKASCPKNKSSTSKVRAYIGM